MLIRNTPDAGGFRRPSRATLAVALLAMTAGLYACAPKITKIDASYTIPEGVVSSNATLIIWSDQPTTAYVYGDIPPADPDSVGDTLITTLPYARQSPRTLHGMIIDNTVADAFQMFRREPGGGIRQFAKFNAPRTRQWLGSQYETFHFIDPVPASVTPPTYICRGIVDGLVNARSPLTNLATPNPAPIQNIRVKAVWWNNTDDVKGPVFREPDQSDRTKVVPKLKVKWDAVTGAARYVVQVYEFRSDLRTNDERILSGTVAPFYDGQGSESFIGYAPGNVNFMFVGDSSRTDITTFAIKSMAIGTAFMVRVAALDANGHLIGLSLGDPNPQRAYVNGEMGLARGVFGNNTYMLYPLCATTARDTTARPGGGGGGGGG